MSPRPLKVLSVCTSLSGGAGRAAYRIHLAVRDAGVDSRMLVKTGGEGDVSVMQLKSFVPDNPWFRAVDWVRNKLKNKIQHARWNRYPDRENVFMSDLRGVDLHGALRRLDYDILHLHWVNLRFVNLKDLPKDKPIVWTLHDNWPFCGICHYFFECERYKKDCGCCPSLHSDKADDLSHKVWQRKAEIYKGMDLHIVTPSRWLGGCARQSSLLARFPQTVIPNCLDVNSFRPLKDCEISPRWRELQERSQTKPFVLFGAMNAVTDKRKGFSILLSALKRLEDRGYQADFEVIVFGASEPGLGMDFTIPVRYVGCVNEPLELVSLYNLASVMVVPSLTENLSCTIMESLSCGTPVVGFDIGGNGDMVEHKKNGYLARESDSEDLADGILWCLNNNKDNCLGRAGRDKVMTCFSQEVVGGRYKSLYDSLLI